MNKQDINYNLALHFQFKDKTTFIEEVKGMYQQSNKIECFIFRRILTEMLGAVDFEAYQTYRKALEGDKAKSNSPYAKL